MKIMLDSSFFFPFIKVELKECTNDGILALINNPKYEIYRSDLALFELSAKGTKYVNSRILSLDDLIDGLNAIQFNSSIKIVPLFYSEVQTLATTFRQNHSDFIDCLTLASAAVNCDIFLTLDHVLQERSHNEWRDALSEQNKKFQVKVWQEFRANPPL